MLALAVINLCAREYADIAFERIARDATSASTPNQANWLDWLNDAQRAVVLVRPEAGSVTEAVKLVAGTKQNLPVGTVRILDVSRNMGADGETPGKTIRLVSDEMKGDTDRDWHTAQDAGVVREVVYNDKKDPKTFYVSPPALDRYIEISLCRVPSVILDADVETAALGLDDLYVGPLQAWMMHRSYAMASNVPGNYQKAWQYFKSFFSQLGVRMKGEMFVAASSSGETPPGGPGA